MKKILPVILIAVLLSGCGIRNQNVKTTINPYQIVELEPGGILYLEGQCKLAPYYDKNGKLCHLVDGEIKEIEE